MPQLTLKLLDDVFTIHSLPVNSSIPEEVFDAEIYFISKTHGEISIVLPQHVKLNSDDSEPNWRSFEVVGPLGFSLTGILASISNVLANEQISIFAISTFDTDFIMVKNDKIHSAIDALQANNHQVIY